MDLISEPVRGGAFWAGRRVTAWVGRRLGMSEATVYAGAPELEAVRPARQTMSRGPIDACWLTGLGVLRGLERGTHGVSRIVLPHPSLEALLTLQASTGQEYDLPRDVEQATRIAQNLGIEVRWYPAFFGTALTIGQRWIHIEPILFHGVPERRPILRLAGRSNRGVIERYRHVFEGIWSNSVLPFAELPRPAGLPEYTTRKHFSGERVVLADLVPPGGLPIIEGKIFDGCQLVGPILVAPQGDGVLVGCTFDGRPQDVFYSIDGDRGLVGVVALQDCTIRKCRFQRVGLVGTAASVADWTRGIPGMQGPSLGPGGAP